MKLLNTIRSSSFLTCFVLCLAVCGPNIHAQDVGINPAEALTRFSAQSIREKLYVHTDKDYYMPGEIIWFKIYCADAFLHKPLSLSKVAYVEILDSANKAVRQEKIALHNATGNGSIYLSQQVASGHYKLRAYTRWMQNDDPHWFFEKKIAVMNLNHLPPVKPVTESNKTQITFFPEGGDLVQGMENRIAFKASNATGKGVAFKGYLLDGQDTLLHFEPEHLGMGTFPLTPEAGHRYRAFIVPENGLPFEAILPETRSVGTSLAVQPTPDGFRIHVHTNEPGNEAMRLLVHTRGITRLHTTLPLTEGKAQFQLPASVPGEGISVVTIFNGKGQPVGERLIFSYPEKELDIKLSVSKPVYHTREAVELQLSTASTDSAEFSLSVYSIDSLQQPGSGNILSYLLLSSDIRGHIENPETYFAESNPDKARQMDLLLRTQGWRRFNWEAITSQKTPVYRYAPELQGHLITGTVFSGEKPASNTTVFLSAPSSLTLFRPATSDVNGNFRADVPNLFGSHHLIAQTESSSYTISIHDPFSRQFSTSTLPTMYRPLENPGTLLQQHIGMQVRNIYSGDQLNVHHLPHSGDTIPFYNRADQQYQLDKYTRFTTMEEVLREYVNLVDVRFKNKEVNLFVIDPLRKAYFENKPLNLLDGVPVFNFTKFLAFDPMKIYSVDVVAKQYVLGNTSFPGILNWRTYAPSAAYYEATPNMLQVDYEGLQLTREFYSPAYDSPDKKDSRIPDFRNVLHWAPAVKAGKNTDAKLRFYTSDLPGKYVVVAEGLSSEGTAGSGMLFFEVK